MKKRENIWFFGSAAKLRRLLEKSPHSAFWPESTTIFL
jgi:hypothetical protein